MIQYHYKSRTHTATARKSVKNGFWFAERLCPVKLPENHLPMVVYITPFLFLSFSFFLHENTRQQAGVFASISKSATYRCCFLQMQPYLVAFGVCNPFWLPFLITCYRSIWRHQLLVYKFWDVCHNINTSRALTATSRLWHQICKLDKNVLCHISH